MQYEIMKALAGACVRCVGVVGDPDQSGKLAYSINSYFLS
jgi:hypothetical protein